MFIIFVIILTLSHDLKIELNFLGISKKKLKKNTIPVTHNRRGCVTSLFGMVAQ